MTLKQYAEALTDVGFHSTDNKRITAMKLALSSPQDIYYKNQKGLSLEYKCLPNRNGDKTVPHLQKFLVHALDLSLKCPETTRHGVIYLLTSLLTNEPSENGYKWLMSAARIPEIRWPEAEEGSTVKDRKTAYRALFLGQLLGYDVSLFVANFDAMAYSEEGLDPSVRNLILEHLALKVELPDMLQPEWYDEADQFWVTGLTDDGSTPDQSKALQELLLDFTEGGLRLARRIGELEPDGQILRVQELLDSLSEQFKSVVRDAKEEAPALHPSVTLDSDDEVDEDVNPGEVSDDSGVGIATDADTDTDALIESYARGMMQNPHFRQATQKYLDNTVHGEKYLKFLAVHRNAQITKFKTPAEKARAGLLWNLDKLVLARIIDSGAFAHVILAYAEGFPWFPVVLRAELIRSPENSADPEFDIGESLVEGFGRSHLCHVMIKNEHVAKEHGWFICQTPDGKMCVCTILEQGVASCEKWIDELFGEPVQKAGKNKKAKFASHSAKSLLEIAVCASQLLDGLSAVHDLGFLHRDVKTANAVFAPNEAGTLVAKHIDVGMMRAMPENDGPLTLGLGTPKHMAPEQKRRVNGKANTGDYDQKVDVYAMGSFILEASSTRCLKQ